MKISFSSPNCLPVGILVSMNLKCCIMCRGLKSLNSLERQSGDPGKWLWEYAGAPFADKSSLHTSREFSVYRYAGITLLSPQRRLNASWWTCQMQIKQKQFSLVQHARAALEQVAQVARNVQALRNRPNWIRNLTREKQTGGSTERQRQRVRRKGETLGQREWEWGRVGGCTSTTVSSDMERKRDTE